MRIGVTGHRSFDDRSTVAARIAELIDELDRGQDGSLEIWSSLAEGADRMVASCVLDDHSGSLVAVLPLQPSDYVDDFEDTSSTAEFERLLGAAREVTVTGPDESGSRPSAYERAGLAVVAAVDLLIAVWDGAPARGRGGTAQIVAAARDRGVEVTVVPVTRTGVTS